MSSLRRLSSSDRRLLIQSLSLVAAIRLGLWLLPFRVMRRLLARMTSTPRISMRADPAALDRVAWAVKRASRHVPTATCFTQALAAQVLLSRCGLSSRLHIGVAREPPNRLVAHAWVESAGRIVVGGPGLRRYTPLLVLESQNR